MGLLVEFVLLGEAPRVAERCFVVAARCRQVSKPFQSGKEAAAEPVLIGKQPIVIEPGEEIAAVQLHRSSQRLHFGPSIGCGGSLVEGRREVVHVQPEIGVGVEAEGVRGSDQVALPGVVAKSGLGLPQRLAEAAPRPRFVEVRPKSAGQQIAGVGSLPVEY